MNLKKIIAEEYKLFIEGKTEDLIQKFPELQPAYDAGIKNVQYLNWIRKRRAGEPVEDIVGVVSAFDKQKQRLKAKGKSPDIYAYKTPAILRQTIEDLGASKSSEQRRIKDEEVTYLGTFGDWIVAMPHTTQASCKLGAGTTWCTAATKTQNLFLSYVARDEESIILYYLIKKGTDPREDPTAKISVGFVNGEPYLEGSHGHITVDAANKGYTASDLQSVLGGQYEPIMGAMKEHAAKVAGEHPAKQQFLDIAQSDDPSKFDNAVRGMEGLELEDFMKRILSSNPSAQVLDRMYEITDQRIEAKFRMYGEAVNWAIEQSFFRDIIESPALSDATFIKALEKFGKFRSFSLAMASRVSSGEASGFQIKKYRAKVRQLAHVIERVVLLSSTGLIEEGSRKKNSKTNYNEGNIMDFTEDYVKKIIKEEYKAIIREKKKKACKPTKGKRFAKRVDGKCRSYGQSGQAKSGGDRIRPGTAKGDAYCARSAKIKKCKNPPCANALSRKKWKCRGSKSMK